MVRDSSERPRWTSAILGVRTGEGGIGRLHGDEESKALPHPHHLRVHTWVSTSLGFDCVPVSVFISFLLLFCLSISVFMSSAVGFQGIDCICNFLNGILKMFQTSEQLSLQLQTIYSKY